VTEAPIRFTVLMSVGRFAELLPYSVASVLAQTETDFELYLLGDPDSARRGRGQATDDARIIAFDVDRATAVQRARGTLVATTNDETLWFPNHLAELAELLVDVEYGRLLRTELDPDGSVWVSRSDLADDAGFRLEAFGRLDGEFGPTAGTRFAIESVTLTSAYRVGPAQARTAEGEAVYRLVSDERGRRDLRSRALASWHADLAAAHAAIDAAAAQIQELYHSRDEISAQLAAYAQSRGEYADENAALHARVGELSGEVEQLGARIGRLRVRNRRLKQRLTAIESSASWRLVRRLSTLRAGVLRRVRRR
jgi:hypothetical protein